MKNSKLLNFKRFLLQSKWIKVFNSHKNNFINKIIISFNKKFKKLYIPHPKNGIYIETTSLCNLNCKFCAYGKRDLNMHPQKTMSIQEFKSILNQCIEQNYSYIGLTPSTGDIFMDKNIFDKFNILENSKLNGFHFYTNFIPIKNEKIIDLLNYEKLKFLGISIYGHNKDLFKKFSGSTDNAYNKFINNLETLNNLLSKNINKIQNISINLRSTKYFILEENNSDLSKIVKEIIKQNNVTYTYTHEYNNWGNLVNKKDVEGLDIYFSDNHIKKQGACSLIFGKNIIGVNGNINACACRDANYTLRLGNIFEKKLKEILSSKNKKYKNLIEQQMNNNFPDVCYTCDFYTSIYMPKNRRGFSEIPERDIRSLKEFDDILDG